MMPFMRLVPLIALLGTATLAGCSQPQAARSFHVDLSPQHEAPPLNTKGSGTADLTLSPATKQLTWKITYAGLSSPVAGAHIHGPARPGETAGVLIDLAPGGIKNPIEGSTTLSDADFDYLMLARCYINLHTTEFKEGEIRGQIVP